MEAALFHLAVKHSDPVSHQRRDVHKLPTKQMEKMCFVEFELENSKSAKEVYIVLWCLKDLVLQQCNEGLVNIGGVLRRGLLLQVAFACGKSEEFCGTLDFI